MIGASISMNTSTNTACRMPAIGLLAPARTLVAVRAMAPVAGRPPNSTEAILPAPCATSSQFERCRRPDMPSATTADSSDSIAPSKAIASASGSTARAFARLKAGSSGAGRLEGTPPKREPMVATSKPSFANTVAASALTTTEIRNPGQVGRSFLSTRMMAIASAATAIVAGRKVGSAAQITSTFGRKAAGSFGISRPSNSLIWLTKMITAMPAVNPTVTGNGIYLM
jgi:hypothetical protein